MKPTYQNRKTGEFFERVWINGSHVGLRPLDPLFDGTKSVTVRRSNLLKSYALADDYRHVPPAPDPPEPIGKPLPPLPLAEAALPGPKPAPRPTDGSNTTAKWGGSVTTSASPPGPSFGWRDALHTDRAQPIPDAPVRVVAPAKTLSDRDRADLRWFLGALVIAALFVVGIWIAVLSW